MKQGKTHHTIKETTNNPTPEVTVENRGTVSAHVKRLMESMAKYGWLDAYPMMVVKRGDKLEIRDGQHRFEAARRLGIPVKYIIVSGAHAEIPICELNKLQKRWSTLDHCRSYKHLGDADYQVLLDFMDRTHLPLIVATALLSQSSPSSATIANGNFRVVDLDWAEMHASYLRMLRAAMPWSPYKTGFVRVFIKACLVPGFEPLVLVQKMRRARHLCEPFSSERRTALMLQDIYNYGCKEKRPLALEIEVISADNRASSPSREKARARRSAAEKEDPIALLS